MTAPRALLGLLLLAALAAPAAQAAPLPRTVLVPTALDQPALRPVDLGAAPDEDLVAAFAVAAAAAARAHRESRVESSNYLGGVARDLADALLARGRGAASKLLPLLAHPDRDVRLDAAYAALRFDPQAAIVPLEALAAPPYKRDWSQSAHDVAWMLETARAGGLTHLGPPDVHVPPPSRWRAPLGPPAPALDEAGFVALVAKHKLAKPLDAIRAARRPAIRMVRQAVATGEPPLGTSRLGGLPDLPAGEPWPTRRGRPLALLAQLDLADVARPDWRKELPPQGRLAFFYDADSQPGICSSVDDPADAGAVLFDPGDRPLVRLPRPADLIPTLVYPSAPLAFVVDWALPTDAVPRALGKALRAGTRFERYQALAEDVEARWQGLPDPAAPGHQLLGFAHPEQDAMEEGLAGRGEDPAAWCLLAEIHSDEAVFGGPWGDAGKIYFWIRRDDLRARRFERTVVLAQCG